MGQRDERELGGDGESERRLEANPDGERRNEHAGTADDPVHHARRVDEPQPGGRDRERKRDEQLGANLAPCERAVLTPTGLGEL